MSHYREVVQCKKCGKIYRTFYFPSLHSYYGRGFTCGKCGWHNYFTIVSAKPKLFGLKGWEPKKASNYYGNMEAKNE